MAWAARLTLALTPPLRWHPSPVAPGEGKIRGLYLLWQARRKSAPSPVATGEGMGVRADQSKCRATLCPPSTLGIHPTLLGYTAPQYNQEGIVHMHLPDRAIMESSL